MKEYIYTQYVINITNHLKIDNLDLFSFTKKNHIVEARRLLWLLCSEHGMTPTEINEARMKLGVKISRDNETGEIIIYDPVKGGDQYIEMQPEQYQLFFDHGWDEAIKSITLDKYKKNLNRLTQNIKKEMNSLTPNNKNLQSFKDSRAYILKKYYRLTR